MGDKAPDRLFIRVTGEGVGGGDCTSALRFVRLFSVFIMLDTELATPFGAALWAPVAAGVVADFLK